MLRTAGVGSVNAVDARETSLRPRVGSDPQDGMGRVEQRLIPGRGARGPALSARCSASTSCETGGGTGSIPAREGKENPFLTAGAVIDVYACALFLLSTKRPRSVLKFPVLGYTTVAKGQYRFPNNEAR
jgi:hypothetical protein